MYYSPSREALTKYEKYSHIARQRRDEKEEIERYKRNRVFFQEAAAIGKLFPDAESVEDMIPANGWDEVIVESPDKMEFIRIRFIKNCQFVTLIANSPGLYVDGSRYQAFFQRRLHPTKQRNKLIDGMRQRLVKRSAQRDVEYSQISQSN